MARETGGIFFMLPSLESNLVRGEKRRYELDIMRPYRVDLRSRAECFFDRDNSKLQMTLWDIIYTLNPYNPQAAQYIELRVHFSRDYPTFVKQVDHELKKLPPYLGALAAASDTVEKLQYEREQETDPRWQANYDLMRAHLVAYQARVYEYGSYIQAFAKQSGGRAEHEAARSDAGALGHHDSQRDDDRGEQAVHRTLARALRDGYPEPRRNALGRRRAARDQARLRREARSRLRPTLHSADRA
jgi:hypothetical protein